MERAARRRQKERNTKAEGSLNSSGPFSPTAQILSPKVDIPVQETPEYIEEAQVI